MSEATWGAILTRGFGCVPAPLPKSAWQSLYALFDAFADFVASEPMYRDIFDKQAKLWQAESGQSLYFSGYFSPYFRDRTGQQGRDNKKVIQFCEPYYRYLWEKGPHLLQITEYRLLTEALMAVLLSSYTTYLPLLAGLHNFAPSLAEALIPHGRMPPLAIRVIKYYEDSSFLTNPHVDKSAVTFILDSDEKEGDPCLVFAPRDSRAVPLLSGFCPATKRDDESLAFLGAAPREAGFSSFEPASHAVRSPKVPSVRHVAIFFWLLPGIDMAPFDTATQFVDDLSLSRDYGKR